MAVMHLIALLSLMAFGAASEDSLSLVQKSVQLHKDLPPGFVSDCTCINWGEAYTGWGAKCGDGEELSLQKTWTGPDAAQIPELKFEHCMMYWNNLPNTSNFCQRKEWNQKLSNDQQWCYVSGFCQNNPHVTKKYGPLSVKQCTPEEDMILGDMKFEELAAFAKRNRIDIAMAAQYAYPMWEMHDLKEVQSFWGLQDAGGEASEIPEWARVGLQRAVDSGKGMVFVTRFERVYQKMTKPPFAVAEGKKLYYINQNPRWGEKGMDGWEDKNTWACVAGCGSENVALW